MTIDKWALKEWLTITEAEKYLLDKSGRLYRLFDIYGFSLEGHLPLVVNVPTGAKSKRHSTGGRGLDFEGGRWDLLMEGERGKPGRRQVEHLRNQDIDIEGIDGAWVEREVAGKRVQRQLQPTRAAAPFTWHSAFPNGCVLEARKKDLDALLAKLKAHSEPDKPECVAAHWEDVTITFTSEYQVQIRVRSPYPQVGTDQSHVVTYADLGFRNERQDKPTLAWEKFRELAEASPQRIDLPPKKNRKDWKREIGDKDRVTVQQRVREIRATLRNALERLGYTIPSKTDPLPLDKDQDCYTPTFSLKRTHSYGSTAPP